MSPEAAPPPRDSKAVLMDAARTAIREQTDKDIEGKVTRGARAHPVRTAIMLLIVLVGAVLLVVRPVWLVGPSGLAPEPPAIAAASVRLTLLRERQRVLDFAKTHGRLPGSLADAGSNLTDIAYTPQDSTRFHLSAFSGDSLIILRSDEGTSSFLGSSLKVLTGRAKP